MAADYLKMGFDEALQKALERHEARRQRFNDNIDSAFQNFGDATKAALQQRRRNEILAEYGGDDSDPELKLAKETYRTTGDPSQLIAYEQGKKQAALTEATNTAAKNAATAATNATKVEKDKLDLAQKTNLIGNVKKAMAAIQDAGVAGNPISNALKTEYESARNALNALYPDEAAKYPEEVKIETPKATDGPSLQELRHAFEKNMANLLDTDSPLTEGQFTTLNDDLEKLHDAGLDFATYRAFKKEIRENNPNIQKKVDEEELKKIGQQRAEQSYQQGQSDRLKQQKKEKKQEEKEAADEQDKIEKQEALKKEAQSWLAVRAEDGASEEDLKDELLILDKKNPSLAAAIRKEKGW